MEWEARGGRGKEGRGRGRQVGGGVLLYPTAQAVNEY